jgi:hypothetical protein
MNRTFTEEVAMENAKLALLEKARDLYGTVNPCSRKTAFEECFSELNDHLAFWFNTQDGSTHVVVENEEEFRMVA